MKVQHGAQFRHPGLWQGNWQSESKLTRFDSSLSTLKSLASSLAELSQQQRWLVLVNPPRSGWKAILEEAGVAMDRLLIVRCQDEFEGQWAVEQALAGRTASAVLAWLPKLEERDWRRLNLASKKAQCRGYLFQQPKPSQSLTHAIIPAHRSNWIH